jgi:hypothetical protein
MLVPSDLRNDGVQDQLPDALYGKDRATADRPLGAFRCWVPSGAAIRNPLTNGLSWSAAPHPHVVKHMIADTPGLRFHRATPASAHNNRQTLSL